MEKEANQVEEQTTAQEKAKSEKIVIPLKEKTLDETPKAQNCLHHFGYLSTRTSKEKIPEECIMCEHIVQCMLKNVTS